MDPFIGEIRMFAGNFPPTGWATCDGQLLPISQNTALFSLLGAAYGGDGRSTFALPNLAGRLPMQWGQGPGLSPRDLGETGGEASVALLASEIPAHTHPLRAVPEAATTASPSAGVLLAAPAQPIYGAYGDPLAMADEAIPAQGQGLPHENRQPYLALTFIIALQGIFPARS